MKPLKVGIIGTGYAAQRRAEALQADERSQLCYVAGYTPSSTTEFAKKFEIKALDSSEELLSHPELDLVVISNINAQHSPLVQGALLNGKHVVVEYPLALTPKEGAALINLAEKQGKMLHVEHIELLGGLHHTIAQYLPKIGEVFYARYITLNPKHPAPQRWTYHYDEFGFPLIGALSRIHRLTNLFGEVAEVSCQARFWDAPTPDYFTACWCNAQLRFTSGMMAEVAYGKGEVFWKSDRTFELHGEQGVLIFSPTEGYLIQGEEVTPITIAQRRGLFAKDTGLVLDYLFEGKPLYVDPRESLSALEVAYRASLAVS